MSKKKQRTEILRRAVKFNMRAESGTDGVLEGHAAVFNSLVKIGSWYSEQIAPTAFDRAIREKHDVRALINHDPNLILGRTGAATPELSVDEIGLKIRIILPGTSYAKDLEESIRRGDIDQMSFAFTSIEEEWVFGDEGDIVTIKDLRLYDVSPVTYAAYPDTDISARSDVIHYKAAKEKHVSKKRAERAKRILKVIRL